MFPIYPVYPPLPQQLPGVDPARFPQPQMGPPMMALVLPNYMFPQMGAALPQPGAAPGHFYNPNFPYPGVPPVVVPSVVPNPVPGAGTGAPSRSSTPQSYSQTPAEREGAESPLFQSRCSSPLNLLQLEESPCNRLEAASQQAMQSAHGGAGGVQASANQMSSDDASKENENVEPNDATSVSSTLLDLLLAEDSRSGTGSAASGSGSSGTTSMVSGSGSASGSGSGSGSASGSGSGSGFASGSTSGSGSGSGSGSNARSLSGKSGKSGKSGTSSSQGSHTSKYFGSIDSSENDHSRKQPAGGGEDQFIKCVLQDPIWLLMANTDEKIMMTYQLPARDLETVLREDRETLRNLQKQQPRFTEEQKRELSQVHPWIRTGRLPKAINISGCTGCRASPAMLPVAPFDVELHEMELCLPLSAKPLEDGAEPSDRTPAETNMEDALPDDEEEEEGDEEGEEVGEEKMAKAEDGSQDMTVEEQNAPSAAAAAEEKAET